MHANFQIITSNYAKNSDNERVINIIACNNVDKLYPFFYYYFFFYFCFNANALKNQLLVYTIRVNVIHAYEPQSFIFIFIQQIIFAQTKIH